MRQIKREKKVKEEILNLFFEYPNRKFSIREIAKLTRIPRATVHKYLLALKKQNLLTKENQAKTSLLFKIKKTNYFVEKIIDSGLIDEIRETLNPSCIILFGSIRKGDSVKESDIDLFIESSVKKTINFNKFEKKLKHKIQIFIRHDINSLQPNLFNNVINGIKLYGSFKIK